MNCGLELGYVVGESVDFLWILRYWVRYWDFRVKVGEMLDFTGFDGIFI